MLPKNKAIVIPADLPAYWMPDSDFKHLIAGCQGIVEKHIWGPYRVIRVHKFDDVDLTGWDAYVSLFGEANKLAYNNDASIMLGLHTVGTVVILPKGVVK